MHDGRDGVEEGERVGPGFRADRCGQRAEVSGPVAMIHWPGGGQSVISLGLDRISGCARGPP
jgi:hypothetical protein